MTRVRRWRQRARLVYVGFLVACAFVTTSCGDSGGSSPVFAPGGLRVGFGTLPPGVDSGFLLIELHNISPSPVVLDHVDIRGRGVGDVVRVVKVEAVPWIDRGTRSIASGVYDTDPPVQVIQGTCHVPALRPVHGYRLMPGQRMRVWVLFRTLHHDGRFNVASTPVYFTSGSEVSRQVMSYGFTGGVSAPALPRSATAAERECLIAHA